MNKNSQKIRIAIMWVTIGLGVLCVWFCLSCFALQSFDAFYHLATGRWIADHGSIPRTDVFSHSAYGQPWITHEWLTQLMFFLISQVSGLSSLVLIKACLGTLAGGLLFLIGNRLGCSPWITGLVVSAGAYMVTFRFFVRPHILTYLLLTGILTVLYGFPSIVRRYGLIIFPVAFALWANLHSGFVFGLLVLGVLLFPCPADRSNPLPVLPARTYLGLMLLCLTAGILNPNTFHAFLYPVLFFRTPIYFNLITELRPLMSPEFRGAFFIPLFWIFIAVSGALHLTAWKRKPWKDLILLSIFGILAINSVRNVPLCAIVCLPGFLARCSTMEQSEGKTFSSSILRITHTVLFLLILIVQVGICLHTVSIGVPLGPERNRKTATGIRSLNYPDAAIEFLDSLPLEGNMFNTFGFGGYLDWKRYPDPRVFIDGRLFVFRGSVVQDYIDTLRGNLSPEILSSRYDITHFLLSFPDRAAHETPQIYTQLLSDPSWHLIYWDDITLLYVKDIPVHHPIIDRHAYQWINPLKSTLENIDNQYRSNPSGVLLETKRNIRINPECSGGQIIMGRCSVLEHRWRDAVSYYRKALELVSGNRIIQRELASSLIQAGDTTGALEILDDLRSVIKNDSELFFYTGLALHYQEKPDQAEQWYLKAYRLNPHHYYLLNNLGILSAQKNQYEKAHQYWQSALKCRPGAPEVMQNLARLEKMSQPRGYTP
jgi:Tetratricopeptide repeat